MLFDLIVGFDTFDGYADGSYRAGPEYALHLMSLLDTHEGCNAFGHLNRNHGIVVGDVTETAPQHFKDDRRPIALAIFDMGPYEPTLAALQAIKPNLLPGSVIMFDEFTTSGEAEAFEKVLLGPYSIENMPMYPSKTVVTLR